MKKYNWWLLSHNKLLELCSYHQYLAWKIWDLRRGKNEAGRFRYMACGYGNNFSTYKLAWKSMNLNRKICILFIQPLLNALRCCVMDFSPPQGQMAILTCYIAFVGMEILCSNVSMPTSFVLGRNLPFCPHKSGIAKFHYVVFHTFNNFICYYTYFLIWIH